MEELLDTMREARQDLNDAARERRDQIRERDAEKERLGALMCEKSLNRKRPTRDVSRSSSDRGHEGAVVEDAESGIDTIEDVTPRTRKRAKRTNPEVLDDDMAEFTGCLRRADEARSSVEVQRLALERERFEFEKVQREREREERSAG